MHQRIRVIRAVFRFMAFVHSDYRHQGLGQHLVDHAIALATTRQLDALFVKAHESAVPFFTKLEFQNLPVVEKIRDYPYRFIRSVI